MPNGVALLRYHKRALSPRRAGPLCQLRGQKGRTGKLDDTHYEAGEYMLTSLLIPERDVFGYEHTIHIYFARIVAATKSQAPSSSLARAWGLGGGAGARDGLVTPVKLIRDEVERSQKLPSAAPGEPIWLRLPVALSID